MKRRDFFGDTLTLMSLSKAQAYACAWREAKRHRVPKALLASLRASMRWYAIDAVKCCRASKERSRAA